MDIKNKTVLVLGAYGLVGNAVTRKITQENPKQVIITSLFKEEVELQKQKLLEEFPQLSEDHFITWWGNIFVREEFKDEDRKELVKDPEKRKTLMRDIMEEMDDEILKSSAIYKLLERYKPDIVVDGINSATGIAYQDIYTTYQTITRKINNKVSWDELAEETEKMICTLYVPQLIRHIQILYNAMNLMKTSIYIKIGTSGTGGMGLNIPYTHSEEKPSRVLLSKSAIGGAHTLLLFLMGRTPEGAIAKEIKPTAAIAWKKIDYGEIKKKGKPIKLVDVSMDEAVKLTDKLELDVGNKFNITGKNLESVFIDTGENGTFSRGEFETITAQGQMEYVTPEEIAVDVLYEIRGGNTGHDIINALDNATFEPTYRAGFMQHAAVDKLEELEQTHNVDSVAFELLGPPRLSKLLYEIYLLKLIYGGMKEITDDNPRNITEKVFELIKVNSKLRNQILSIGIPILFPDGESLLRGNEMKIPPYRGEGKLDITEDKLNLWASDGWIDLRESNMEKWQKRLKQIIAEAERIKPDDTSSMYVRTKKYWNNFETIDIGKVVGWIFIKEEHGERMKA